MRESLQNSFHWRPVNNLPAPAGKVATVVARAEVGVSTVSSMLVGCCLYDEKGGVGGAIQAMRLRPDCNRPVRFRISGHKQRFRG